MHVDFFSARSYFFSSDQVIQKSVCSGDLRDRSNLFRAGRQQRPHHTNLAKVGQWREAAGAETRGCRPRCDAGNRGADVDRVPLRPSGAERAAGGRPTRSQEDAIGPWCQGKELNLRRHITNALL